MTRRNPKAIDDEIDRNLKRAFDAVAEEPVPDRLLTLLDRLRTEDAAQQPKGKTPDHPRSKM